MLWKDPSIDIFQSSEQKLRLAQDSAAAQQMEQLARQLEEVKRHAASSGLPPQQGVRTLRGGGGKKKGAPIAVESPKPSGWFGSFFKSSPAPRKPEQAMTSAPSSIFDF
jgi:hypothetical protein